MAAAVEVTLDTSKIEGFAKLLAESPKEMLRQLSAAFREIGRGDIESLRAGLPGRLNIRSKGLAKSFKFKATDAGKATDLNKLFVDEYTGWKSASIFQTGGTVAGKGKQMTVLLPAAIGPSGRRIYTQRQLRQRIAEGKIRFVPTPRGVLLIEFKGGYTKRGKMRKSSRDVVIGILKRQIDQTKRLDFFENFERNQARHTDQLETAVENTLVDLATKDAPGK